YTADLIIGADGIRSKVRDTAVVTDETVLPLPSAHCAYRATIPRDVMLADPLIAHLMTDVNSNCWIGYRRHIMAYPIRNGEMYNMVLVNPGQAPVGKWNVAGDLEEMRNHYKTYDPVVQRLLSHVTSTLQWVLADMPKLPRWVKGNVALIGDAAHAMLPYLAQGAAQAIED
ncbi:Salicylate hydroxylase (Salicylate 1-monooxygenase), partial [Candida maltosa Xu316]